MFRCISSSARILVIVSLVALLMPGVTRAQDEEENKYRWYWTADLSIVSTRGNSDSQTLGLGATGRREWPKSTLNFEIGGTKTESSLITRRATGSTNAFVTSETKNSETTAELFFARGRYGYKLAKKFLVFGGADWLRNRPAGIDSRFLIAAGAGVKWVDYDAFRFSTDLGITYTFETEVVNNPFLNSNFPGVRLLYDLWWQASKSTEFISTFILDWNLDNTDDVRIEFFNALPISINSKLSLTPSYQILWRNDPALANVDLYDPSDPNTPIGTVPVQLKEFDTLFTLTLVLKI